MNRLTLTLVAVAALTAACGDGADTVAVTDEATAGAAAGAADQPASTTTPEAAPVDAGLLVDAVWTTTEAGSSRSSFSAEVTAQGEAVTFAGEGYIDFAAERGSLDLDISQLLQANGMASVDGTFDMIFDGNVSYLQAPLLNTLFSAPTPWLQYDVASLPPSGTSSFADGLRGLTQFAGHDPATPLDLLTGVIPGTAHTGGTETVRGVETTRYTARVDISDALATTPAPVRERLTDRLGVDELEVEAFLDGEGRLVRLAYVEGAPGSDHPTSVAYEFFDFGVPVVLDIPASGTAANLFEVAPPL